MHRIPRFFIHSEKSKSMDSKQKRRKPKLERRNAMKFYYEPAITSSSSASEESASAPRSRSLDILPFGDRTSFRVEGNDGEYDEILRSLGLTGEDFAIPKAAWDAMLRSTSDLLPRSRGIQSDSSKVETPPPPSPQVVDGGGSELSDRFADSVRIYDVAEQQIEPVELIDCCTTVLGGSGGGGARELASRLEDSAIVSGVTVIRNEPGGGGGRGGGGGIRGMRPPVLAPPPSMALPVVDNACSTWDLLRSFAPDGDRTSSYVSGEGFSSSDGEGEECEGSHKREKVTGVRLGETAVLSESCSFTTTSNDDDSSSTTTEPMSNISPNGKFRCIINSWEKGDLLGRGSFGSVYEGIADGGFFFAVKEVSLLDQGDQGRQSIYQLEQEIDLLSQFEHENIVQYYGTDKDQSTLYIFLELVKGSLLKLYQKYNLRDSQVSAYTRQILHGLKYLHDQNVVHRDIKCANILVATNGSVKLADFGLAKATKLNDVKSCKGTAFWMAPEVVSNQNQGYGLPADIWSLGCTVLEMLTGKLPYSPLECMPALFRIGRGLPPPIPDSLSKEARDFILHCLQVNPNARPTAAQLLEHPFVKNAHPSFSGSASPLNLGRRL